MILIFKQARCIVVPLGDKASLTIIPGVNIVPDATWAKIRPTVAARIGKDFTEVTQKVTSKGVGGKETEADTLVSPKDLDVKAADLVILEIKSIAVCDAWMQNESRESVRAALYRRRDQISKEISQKEKK